MARTMRIHCNNTLSNPRADRFCIWTWSLFVAFSMVATSTQQVLAEENKAAEPKIHRQAASLKISPAKIRIGGASRHQQLLVTAIDANGRPFDVTHHSEISLADSHVATVDGSVVVGVADGTTQLLVRYGQHKKNMPIVVEGYNSYPPVNFANDVVPIFSKLGCNSGGCHGKQAGQNGFKLSVFGFDAHADYNSLVKEGRGRRLFPAEPEASLLVTKGTSRVAHGGGQRTETGSPDAILLTEWVRQGMPWGVADALKLVSLEIEPASRVLAMQADQQILVTAVYSDGSRRDVTSATAYTSNSDVVAEVDAAGHVHTGKVPGEAAITVNYMGQVDAVQILVPRPGAPSPYPVIPENNQVDRLVWAKLKKMGIVPSRIADDATFFRRLHLDAIGTLPTTNEVRKFLADDSKEKRNRAISQVLDRDEFADLWANKWGDILLVDRNALGERGSYEFHRWLREQLTANRPYDEWVRELLTATGNSGKYGPVNFYRALRTSEELARAVSQAFLGIRLDCAQCHHHPFEIWAEEDFYGMAGFFNGLKRKKLADSRELVYHAGHQTAKLPLSGKPISTKPPGGNVPANLDDGDPRIKLAQWITARENPWFARLVANRLWKHYMGRGLTEPEDDLRSTNPATNEPLLAYLTEQVVANDYDLKAVMRLILESRVYQLSSKPNETNYDDTQNFSHHLVRRLPAAVLLDAICQVTSSPEQYPGMPAGTRAIELWDNRLPSYFLDTFGRSERRSPCECGSSSEPTMAQTLHLMNAPEIDMKITHPQGRIAKMLATKVSQKQLVEELCLAALGRRATDKEHKVAKQLFGQESPRQAAEDFLWTLMNSYDFLFIH